MTGSRRVSSHNRYSRSIASASNLQRLTPLLCLSHLGRAYLKEWTLVLYGTYDDPNKHLDSNSNTQPPTSVAQSSRPPALSSAFGKQTMASQPPPPPPPPPISTALDHPRVEATPMQQPNSKPHLQWFQSSPPPPPPPPPAPESKHPASSWSPPPPVTSTSAYVTTFKTTISTSTSSSTSTSTSSSTQPQLDTGVRVNSGGQTTKADFDVVSPTSGGQTTNMPDTSLRPQAPSGAEQPITSGGSKDDPRTQTGDTSTWRPQVGQQDDGKLVGSQPTKPPVAAHDLSQANGAQNNEFDANQIDLKLSKDYRSSGGQSIYTSASDPNLSKISIVDNTLASKEKQKSSAISGYRQELINLWLTQLLAPATTILMLIYRQLHLSALQGGDSIVRL